MHLWPAAVLLLLPLSGCIGRPAPLPVDSKKPIAVSTVINGIKCELNAFYRASTPDPNNVLALDPKYMSSIDITLKVLTTDSAGVSAKAILPFTGIELTPSFEASRKTSRTITQSTSYIMQQKAVAELKDCANVEKITLNGMQLRTWLGVNLKDQTNIVRGEPKVGLATTSIETSFGVVDAAGGGVGIAFVPLSISPSAAAAQEDVQTLKIVFRGLSAPVATSPTDDQYTKKIQSQPGPITE